MPAGMAAPAIGSSYSLYNVANATYKGGYYMAQAVLNLGARQVTVPMAFRVAGAASYLAGAAIAPYVTVGLLAYEAYPYIRDWLARDPAAVDLILDSSGKIVQPAGSSTDYPTLDAVKAAFGGSTPWSTQYWPADVILFNINIVQCAYVVGQCSQLQFAARGGWFNTVDVSGVYTMDQFRASGSAPSAARVAELQNVPIDPRALPPLGISVPVDPTPVINPPDFADVPALAGPAGNTAPFIQSRPFAVPNGEPIAVPNTSPVEYVQPWWEVTPAPTAQDPYRVQVISTTTTVVIDRPVITAPPPVVPLTCDLFPNSLGCIPLAPIPEPEEVPQVERLIALQAGPSFSGGSCPADVRFTVHGSTFTVADMSTACSWLSMARPVFLLLAALTAVSIVRPGGGKKHAPTA